MAKLSPSSFQNQLAGIYKSIQQGQAGSALLQLKKLARKVPDNSDLSHITALAYSALGDVVLAKKHFLKSLKLNPQQPQVHNNLANLYKSTEEFSKAEKHYTLALSGQIDFSDAKRNLALCMATQEKHDAAIVLYRELLARDARDISTTSALADSLRLSEQFEEANSYYLRAIDLSPSHLNAWHNMGLNHHLNGNLEKARECYSKAFEIAPNQPQVVQSYANSLHELGATQDAVSLLGAVLATDSSIVFLHDRLNELLWESNKLDQFCESYKSAIKQHESNIDLRVNYVAQLFRAAQVEQARLVVDEAVERFPTSYELLALRGQIYADLQFYDIAEADLSRSLQYQFTKDAAQPLVKLFILRAYFAKAQTLLDDLFKEDQDCQLTWALQSLVWRLTKDDRYYWLNDYDKFVRAYTLEAPAGYESSEEFIVALEKLLLSRHLTEKEPLQQTLRNGTQTAARLLHSSEPELVALKASLTSIVRKYVEELPSDSSHPLLRRKSENTEFSGSWSVKLQANGFHVNHVHPAGWISSSCYIHIPDTMQKHTDSQEGCIKFGESPLDLGELEVVEKVVRPEAGMVVLFPSYMWHGTYPFSGDESVFRMTAPFDVIPSQ